jgi:hypothetical protein
MRSSQRSSVRCGQSPRCAHRRGRRPRQFSEASLPAPIGRLDLDISGVKAIFSARRFCADEADVPDAEPAASASSPGRA